jgi:hypothetical protein
MASKPKMPKPQPVTRMPVPDDENALAAKKRAQNALMAQRGRESTDLTGGTDGTAYLGK